MEKKWEKLVKGIKDRDLRSLARMITHVENREPGWEEAMKALYGMGNALVIGITGSPGAGKSTLTNAVALKFAKKGFSIGIIAVDPSSPFSGGALLGDRLRMKDINTSENIFIRSMATRGALGGLCQGARDVARIMSAFGKDIIIIETVGVGQDEVEVVKAADLVAVVCVPGQGDGIQALKAGIMEIADIYVVNKADLGGADEVKADILGMLSLSMDDSDDIPPVILASAFTGMGIDELAGAMETKSSRIKASWLLNQAREEILSLMAGQMLDVFMAGRGMSSNLDAAALRIIEKKADPYTMAEELLASFREQKNG